jgi:hypothetical protein
MQTKPQYAEPSYNAPFTGWHTRLPENLIPATATPLVANFILRNGEIRSAPKLKNIIPHPDDSNPIRALTSFKDTNDIFHTISITSSNLWQLIFRAGDQNRNPWIWNKVSAIPAGNDAPYSTQVFSNKLYFTKKTVSKLWAWDGISPTIETVSPFYGAAFMGQLGFHLILLNTIEQDEATSLIDRYPQRVRWSPSGIFNVWNPAVNANAGFNDQVDVPDAITGFLTIGKAGYIFRSNGITQMTLTGNGARPFNFDHLWASDKGIGNIMPRSLAAYGSIGIFISDEDIYSITVSSFEAIGGGARDAIFADLTAATDVPSSTIISGYGHRFKYLTYNLFIPRNNSCVLWIYNIEDRNWTRRYMTQGYPTCAMRMCEVI